jgi:hypothetical protein
MVARPQKSTPRREPEAEALLKKEYKVIVLAIGHRKNICRP